MKVYCLKHANSPVKSDGCVKIVGVPSNLGIYSDPLIASFFLPLMDLSGELKLFEAEIDRGCGINCVDVKYESLVLGKEVKIYQFSSGKREEVAKEVVRIIGEEYPWVFDRLSIPSDLNTLIERSEIVAVSSVSKIVSLLSDNLCSEVLLRAINSKL